MVYFQLFYQTTFCIFVYFCSTNDNIKAEQYFYVQTCFNRLLLLIPVFLSKNNNLSLNGTESKDKFEISVHII